MSADQLVLEMSSQTEGNPSVFLKKDWLSILDNTSGSYSSNQAVIDTSQLANSNKYMNYQEAYLAVPLLITLSAASAADTTLSPATAASSCDHTLGLKNSYTSLIHSFTLDYNGQTVIQQQPFVSIWNAFRLMTTLSWEDVVTQGSTIGFYPDDALSFAYNAVGVTSANTQGFGVCFNNNALTAGPPVSGVNNSYNVSNIGFLKRQQYVNYDAAGLTAPSCSAFSTLLTDTNANTLYKSQIIKKQNGATSPAVIGVFQQQIMAIIKLKHIHSFFENIPLLKGVFMKMTLSLNNANITFATSAAGTFQAPGTTAYTVSVPSGGVNPLMIASGVALPTGAATANGSAASLLGAAGTYYASLSVGNTCLNTLQSSQSGVGTSSLLKQITLNVPAYSLAPVFEAAYLSSPMRKIDFTDIYSYQVLNTIGGANFNALITNGIAGIKSVLVLPFLTSASNAMTLSPLLSPFDAAGCGPTSPLCLLNNFNVVVAGANAIYNTERYTYEHFCNQYYGQRAINGGLIDGSTSGLIGQLDWETAYNYYYVNVARALPIEDNVPKSISIVGQNMSVLAIDLYVFIEYAQSLTVDVLTGQRV
jgi:hypothetical protein